MLNKRKVIDLRNVLIENENHPVLHNVNFELVEAEFCYIIGKSGSGKTTLLKSLYGELPISEGFASILDTDLIGIKEKEIPYLRRKLGMVFQQFHLFEKLTVQENLEFVLKATEWKDGNKIQERINEVLKQVNLSNKSDEKIFSLSGGEQQRIALARAILNKPKLLIADEPTGSLDSYSSDQILYLISELASTHKMSVLFATHDQRILDKFPARVYECSDAALIEIE